MSVRVRYAPSPTGLQHIGSLRTALFNYFYSRSQGGKFVLRVEDTDQERSTPDAIQDIYDTFEWIGVSWDEGPDKGGDYGPYVQSERFDIYRSHADELLAKGVAYRCFCTPERLESVRAEQKKNKSKVIGYDRHCRDLDPEEAARRADAGEPFVIRLKIPLEGKTVFHDEILGDVKRKNEDINPDPVIVKTDGYPTYHLANVIDDHLMEITHIMRAQEWIPSGPLHVQLYEAFGWEPPKYVHLPMVMGKDGSKLSKRHGATSVLEFRKAGYLPEALLNYVTMVGWSYDDSTEFFSKDELERVFDIAKITKSPGVFDYKKLDWFNGQYMRRLSDEDFRVRVQPFLADADIDLGDGPTSATFDRLIPLIKERMKLLADVVPLTKFVFHGVDSWNLEELIPKKLDAAAALTGLKAARELVKGFADRSEEDNDEVFRAKAEEMGVKLGDLLMPLRVAVTGSRMSPPLFAAMGIIGEEESLRRIDGALAVLEAAT